MARSAARMRRATTYLIVGILLLVPTAFSILALVAVFAYEPDPVLRNLIAAVWGTCLVLFGVPLFVVIWLWRKHRTGDTLLRRVGSVLSAYDTLPLAALADRLGKTLNEAEALVVAAIVEGHATGFIDHATGTFRNTGGGVPPAPGFASPGGVETGVTAKTARPPAGSPAMRYCRRCGNRVYPREGGETWQCWSCGHEQTHGP